MDKFIYCAEADQKAKFVYSKSCKLYAIVLEDKETQGNEAIYSIRDELCSLRVCHSTEELESKRRLWRK